MLQSKAILISLRIVSAIVSILVQAFLVILQSTYQHSYDIVKAHTATTMVVTEIYTSQRATTTMKQSGLAEKSSSHLSDWPNSCGFQSEDEQRLPVQLRVVGSIPSYAAGTLYRTGPGKYKVDTKDGKQVAMSHWFDGFNQVHRFQISLSTDTDSATTVYYNSRRTCDGLIENIRKTGRLQGFSFGQKRDPCQSFFSKLVTTFSPSSLIGVDSQNVGVTLSVNMPSYPSSVSGSVTNETDSKNRVKTLINKTDAAQYQEIDPETLEPIGIASQASLHPDLKGPLSAAHAKSCPVTSDVYNFNLEISKDATYRIFCASASTQKTTVLATITDAPAAYLHSLFLTQNYVVLCIWGSHFAYRGVSMLYNRNILDSIKPTDPTKPTRWYVIDHSAAKRGVVATYETPAFYCFHTINAYEEPSLSSPGQTDIVADLIRYDDLSVLHRFYYENLTSEAPGASRYLGQKGDAARAQLARYRLLSIPGTADKKGKPGKAIEVFRVPRGLSLELPTMNGTYTTKKHRYIYGVTDRGSSSFFDGLGKFDTETQTTIHWQEKAQTAGEPIFVLNPEGKEEDDGVLLSVVLDGYKEKSYLLCLDAKNLKEVGRAEVDGVVGFGFHGIHVPYQRIGKVNVMDV